MSVNLPSQTTRNLETTSGSIGAVENRITAGVVDIDEETMISLIQGNAPLREEFVTEIERGSFVLKWGSSCFLLGLLLVFHLMLDDKEKEIIRMKLGIESEEEEE